MNLITKEGVFDADVRNQINQMLSQAMGILVGDVYYVDGANGVDTNTGIYPSTALKTPTKGYAKLRTGRNDVLVVIGNGATSGTARIGAAFDWAKSAAHLVGVCPPGSISQRARLAPSTDTDAFANVFTVSGSGCYVRNIQMWAGFTTGTTSCIGLTVSGQRNVFDNCHIAGLADTASAQNTASRSLKITGGENEFNRCTIGIDTVTRTVANASLELASGTARNAFRDCVFPFYTSAATALGVLTSAAAAADRYHLFERCLFINAVKSAGTTMTALATLAASTGGMLVFKDCCLVGITGFGSDATTRAQIYIEGGTPAAASTGLAVAPTA